MRFRRRKQAAGGRFDWLPWMLVLDASHDRGSDPTLIGDRLDGYGGTETASSGYEGADSLGYETDINSHESGGYGSYDSGGDSGGGGDF